VQEEWVARYNGPGNFDDFVHAIAVDSQGNVSVTGDICVRVEFDDTGIPSCVDSDYATIKYDPDGNELWIARYNGPGNGFDEATALALDPAGNVYVTGASLGAGTGSDYATIKYYAQTVAMRSEVP